MSDPFDDIFAEIGLNADSEPPEPTAEEKLEAELQAPLPPPPEDFDMGDVAVKKPSKLVDLAKQVDLEREVEAVQLEEQS